MLVKLITLFHICNDMVSNNVKALQEEFHPFEKRCRLLSLSGGGAKGAYAVGVLASVVEQLGHSENYYDVFSGVSVGSINALGMSLYDYGEEKEMV